MLDSEQIDPDDISEYNNRKHLQEEFRRKQHETEMFLTDLICQFGKARSTGFKLLTCLIHISIL